MSTTTHPSAIAGQSQADLILNELRRTPGEWQPMPLLARLSGAYAVHSRVADLRARGHRIEHRNLRSGRAIHSFYRLSEEAAPE